MWTLDKDKNHCLSKMNGMDYEETIGLIVHSNPYQYSTEKRQTIGTKYIFYHVHVAVFLWTSGRVKL